MIQVSVANFVYQELKQDDIEIEHPLVKRLKQEDGRFDDWSSLLFDQATLADGGKLEDPVGFVRRMNDLLLASSH